MKHREIAKTIRDALKAYVKEHPDTSTGETFAGIGTLVSGLFRVSYPVEAMRKEAVDIFIEALRKST